MGADTQAEVEDPSPGTRDNVGWGHLAQGPTLPAEKARSELRRDNIAQAMWVSYQQLLQERGEDFEDW